MAPGPLLVMGAGSIGCYVGGCLRAAGVDVTFVGRPRVLEELREHGLTLTALDGQRAHVDASALTLVEAPPAGLKPSLVLFTVKSGSTGEAAIELGKALPAGTPVLSLQNGVGNVDTIRAAAPALDAIAGMVPFNVAATGPGHFHRGTSGRLVSADHPVMQAWQPVFTRAGLPLDLHADMRSMQWGKLLLNLNNPVNALSGLPLRAQLLDRGFRVVLAALMKEALRVLARARIDPAPLTPLPMTWLPTVLRLPTPLFRRVAARMLQIDGHARSSMADDLARGRSTEIDALCGAIVRLAEGLNCPAPLNARIAGLIREQSVVPHRYDAARLKEALGIRW